MTVLAVRGLSVESMRRSVSVLYSPHVAIKRLKCY